MQVFEYINLIGDICKRCISDCLLEPSCFDGKHIVNFDTYFNYGMDEFDDKEESFEVGFKVYLDTLCDYPVWEHTLLKFMKDTIHSRVIGLKSKDCILVYEELLNKCHEFTDTVDLTEVKSLIDYWSDKVNTKAEQTNNSSLNECAYYYHVLKDYIDEFILFIRFIEDSQFAILENCKTVDKEFVDLFKFEYKGRVKEIIFALEKEGILNNRIFEGKDKGELAKIIAFLRDNNILSKEVKATPTARVIYKEFGWNVVDKINKEERSITAKFVSDIINGSDYSPEDNKYFKRIFCSLII